MGIRNPTCKFCGVPRTPETCSTYLDFNGKSRLTSICRKCNTIKTLEWKKKNARRIHINQIKKLSDSVLLSHINKYVEKLDDLFVELKSRQTQLNLK